MKTPSNELFQLVKSLDSREKAFFRIYISKSNSKVKSKKAYVILFNELNTLPEFDEETLKQKLAKKGVTGKLSFLKNYLSAAILKSLEEYHSETRHSIMMNQLLIQADILINKNLFSKAFTIIKRGEEIARKTENFLFLCLFKRIRYTTLFNMNDVTNFESFRHIDAPEFFNALDLEKNLLQHNLNSVNNAILSSHYGLAKNPGALKKYQDLHHQFSKIPEPLSITAQRSDLTMKMWFSMLTNKHHECLKYLNEIEKLFYQGGKEYILYHVESFFRLYQNKILFLYYCNKVHEINFTYLQVSQFFNKIPEKLKFPKIIGSFLRVELNYSSVLLLYGETEKAIVAINKLNKNYFKNQLKDPLLLRQITLLFANYYFVNADFINAKKYLFNILNTSKNNIILNSQTIAIMLLRIIVLFELNEFDLMGNVVRSTTRALFKKDQAGFEKIFLQNFSKIASEITNRNKEKSVCISTRKQLLKIIDKTSLLYNVEMSEIITWLDSKIQNRPFTEIIKKRTHI